MTLGKTLKNVQLLHANHKFLIFKVMEMLNNDSVIIHCTHVLNNHFEHCKLVQLK
jgi:hypothetical protein